MVLAACSPSHDSASGAKPVLAFAAPARPTFTAADTGPSTRVVATADRSPYVIKRTSGTMTVVAGHAGGNEREFIVSSDAAVVGDQQSCAEWTSQPALAQQGAVLRLHPVVGGTQAITVTKNIFFGAFWIFNVHVWDTTTRPRSTLVGRFDLSAELRVPGTNVAYPLPWFFCAAVRDSTLAFKVWRDGQPEPAWGNTDNGVVMTLPNGHTDPGVAGWYTGHLAGGAATFTHLATSTWDTAQAH